MKSYLKKHYRLFAILVALICCNLCASGLTIFVITGEIVEHSAPLYVIIGYVLGIIFWASNIIFIYLREKDIKIPDFVTILDFMIFVAYVAIMFIYFFLSIAV